MDTVWRSFDSVRARRRADGYLLHVDLDNSQILYSSFWGGGKKDAAAAVALGPGEVVTIVAESYSEDLTRMNPLQAKLGSANDAFVAQFCDPWLGSCAVEVPVTLVVPEPRAK